MVSETVERSQAYLNSQERQRVLKVYHSDSFVLSLREYLESVTHFTPTETFAVVFIASNLAERGNAGVVTIEDNDGGDSGRPILNIGDAAVREGDDQEAEVELELSQPSSEEISVEVASRQRTAVSGPGNDYLGRNYVVTFAPGETMKTVSWGIVDDALTESSETFVVVFVASNSAKPGTEGTVTISDND